PNAAPSLSRGVLRIQVLSIRRRRNQPLWLPAPIHLSAARCYWPDGQPADKHNHFPELPFAIVSVPTMSAAKTQAESAMAIHSDLPRPPVFVAPRAVKPKPTAIKMLDVSQKSRFSIQASHTLSEHRGS